MILIFCQDDFKPFGETLWVSLHFGIEIGGGDVAHFFHFIRIKLKTVVVNPGKDMIELVFPKAASHICFVDERKFMAEILQKLTDTKLADIPYYHFTVGTVAGVSDVIISNTGYTGSGGFEIYFRNEDAEKLWDEILKAGESEGIIPCGLAARDTLRLEKGFCLYGMDIDDTTSPIEAGLGWITKFDKDFISKETFAKQKEEGVTRKLVGFELTDKGVPRHDYPVVDAEGNVIGRVTSGTQSPMKKIGLGIASRDISSEAFVIFAPNVLCLEI